MTSVLIRRGNSDKSRDRGNISRQRKEIDIYKPRGDASEENNPANTLVPDILLPNFCCLSHSACESCYGSPSKIKIKSGIMD